MAGFLLTTLKREDCLVFGALKGEKMTKLAKVSLILAALALIPVQGFGQDGPNEKRALRSYPDDIPIAADRNAPRYQKDSHFPAEEIKFIGEEKGETHVYEDVMAQYLSPETIQEVKSRPLKWLIVRNAYQDSEYRHDAGNEVEYPIIVDMRFVQLQKFSGFQLNSTLQAVYVVTEVNGRPQKIEFLKFNNTPTIAAAWTYIASAEQLMRAVVGDTLNKVYGLSPETRLR